MARAVEAPVRTPPPPPAQPTPPRPSTSPGTNGNAADRWRQLVDTVRAKSPRHGKSLAFGRLIRFAEDEVVIAFTSEHDFHRSTVSGNGRTFIEQAMAELYGRPVKLTIDARAAAEAPPSIAEEEQKEKAAHERTVDHRVRHNPALQAALRILGGEIEHIQILERERPSVVEPEAPDDAN